MTNRIQTPWASLSPSATVVAVTKTFPFEAVAAARAMGLRHIGENRVEEAGEKIQEARERGFTDITWHMIGHVQSRKARETAALFDWVDSVDSVELLQKLDSAAGAFSKTLHVLLEVNLSGEKSKYGFDLTGWEKNPRKLKNSHILVYENLHLKNVIVEGLMTMAPYTTNLETNRRLFQSMKKLSEAIRAQIPSFGSQLSMGTSCDYQVAIEEGATQIRLGVALFGPRQ